MMVKVLLYCYCTGVASSRRCQGRRNSGPLWLLMSSEKVLANWPAEMSHSHHGECDFDPQRTDPINSLLADHMTLDHAATLMGVSRRNTRRILEAYREEGVPALAHGHRGRWAPNATPEPVATAVVHLARTKYAEANHTHLSELLSEREGIEIGRSTLWRILVNAGLSSPE